MSDELEHWAEHVAYLEKIVKIASQEYVHQYRRMVKAKEYYQRLLEQKREDLSLPPKENPHETVAVS